MSRGEDWSLARLAALGPGAAESVPLPVLEQLVGAATDDELAHHPYVLLHLARALEPAQLLSRRTAAIDRLDALLTTTATDDEQRVRLALECRAERAIDLSRTAELDPAEGLARHVLGACGPSDVVAQVRANEALGRVLAWRGDEMSARAANRVLTDVAAGYAELGMTDAGAHAIFWRGNAVHYQHGDLTNAESAMREALDLFDEHSPRRGTVLTFLADVLTMRGRWSEVEVALDEAAALAAEYASAMTAAYVSWQRARVASVTDDPAATERHLHDAERNVADWFDITTGSTYLADAAELLDRVGLTEAADRYLARAVERDATDEFVMQAQAAILARRGDPAQALTALRALTHAPWLEVRLTWRRTLLAAYATLRSGDDGAGALAARALDQADALGDVRIALIGEPELAQALMPLAALAGSQFAEALLPGEGDVTIRVMGQVSVRRGGRPVELPTGQPAKIVRLLAVHPQGLDVEEVIDALWPDEDTESGRRRLRGALTRLRSRGGDLVMRSGSRLSLAAGWIDASAFRRAADRALSGHGPAAEPLVVAALALWAGELLPSDPYEAWAAAPREQLRRRRLDLLDRLASSATERGSFDEARLALEQGIEADPFDETRYVLAAEALIALGRRQPAQRMLERATAVLRDLGLPPTDAIVATLRRIG